MSDKYIEKDFQIQGQLLSFVIKKGEQVKYLRIIIKEREYWLKLAKPLRKNLDPAITPGCFLEVRGTEKRCHKTGIIKWQAEEVWKISQLGEEVQPQVSTQPAAKSKTILVCQKSACARRGADQLCAFLGEKLRNQGLESQIRIKGTGCMKQCKQGPNLVIMPDKAHYRAISPEQLETILAQHLV